MRWQRGKARTSTEIIAKGVEQPHASVIKLVRRYAQLLSEFGLIRFEIRLNKHGKRTEFSLLNERQATFLITLMRDTEKVVVFGTFGVLAGGVGKGHFGGLSGSFGGNPRAVPPTMPPLRGVCQSSLVFNHAQKSPG